MGRELLQHVQHCCRLIRASLHAVLHSAAAGARTWRTMVRRGSADVPVSRPPSLHAAGAAHPAASTRHWQRVAKPGLFVHQCWHALRTTRLRMLRVHWVGRCPCYRAGSGPKAPPAWRWCPKACLSHWPLSRTPGPWVTSGQGRVCKPGCASASLQRSGALQAMAVASRCRPRDRLRIRPAANASGRRWLKPCKLLWPCNSPLRWSRRSGQHWRSLTQPRPLCGGLAGHGPRLATSATALCCRFEEATAVLQYASA
mmetsp:Transcript_22031/g.63531  ORF Transcript_22031/g.63531 Transcript_22031/m.63531 type:complete len:256 (+) Transcript_22031:4205-4972(+)